MPRIFQATYTTHYLFKIPTNLFLLDEHDEKNDGVQVGSWWVKWATFRYIDKDGTTQEIEYDLSSEEKRPDNVEELDPESDDEDEDPQPVEMPLLFTCGSIIDCPAAREIEKAGLAAQDEDPQPLE